MRVPQVKMATGALVGKLTVEVVSAKIAGADSAVWSKLNKGSVKSAPPCSTCGPQRQLGAALLR